MDKRYHYTYRVKFPAQRWYYYGIHSTNRLNDGYCGSPKTHKDKWKTYAWEFEILEFFDSRAEAKSCENRLIRHFINDPQCLNEAVNGEPSLLARSKGGKTSGKRQGRKNAESGQLRSIASLGGKAAVAGGHLAKARKLPRPGRSFAVLVTAPNGARKTFGSIRECYEAQNITRFMIYYYLRTNKPLNGLYYSKL